MAVVVLDGTNADNQWFVHVYCLLSAAILSEIPSLCVNIAHILYVNGPLFIND